MRSALLLFVLVCVLSNVDARFLRKRPGRIKAGTAIKKGGGAIKKAIRKGGSAPKKIVRKIGQQTERIKEMDKQIQELEDIQDAAYWQEQELIRKENELKQLMKEERGGGRGRGGRGGGE